MSQALDLESVFRKYGDFVFRTCARYFRNPDDARDVSQEVFLKLHARLPGFRGESTLTTWIYRIATNCCIDALRARRPGSESGLDEQVAMNLTGSENATLARIDLERILSEVDKRTREILFLALAEGCTHEEVGEVVGMGKWAVTKTVARFQKDLKRRKNSWYQELFREKIR